MIIDVIFNIYTYYTTEESSFSSRLYSNKTTLINYWNLFYASLIVYNSKVSPTFSMANSAKTNAKKIKIDIKHPEIDPNIIIPSSTTFQKPSAALILEMELYTPPMKAPHPPIKHIIATTPIVNYR